MVTKKTSTTEAVDLTPQEADIKAIRKQAFKEAADRLRCAAAELQQNRESVQAGAPKFVVETSAFKLETRSILERVNALQSQAGIIEAME